jgi:transposase
MREEQGCIYIQAQSLTLTEACPSCKHKADRIHSYYQRTLKDLPIADQTVQLHLTVRRFRCLNPCCPRKTFAESLGPLALKHAQRTQRFTSASTALGLALSGEAGQRAASQLHLPASPDTLLRMIRRVPIEADARTFRVIGIDDWAYRRSTSYGTLIVDLEQHRPVDLLSDRSAETVAVWLKQHPEIQIVTRDRSTEYARGISLGAPEAQQVADRWHLLKNLTEVLERILSTLRTELSHFVARQSESDAPVVRRIEIRAKNEPLARMARREQRKARYEQVRALAAQGVNQRAIAHQLRISRTTIRKFVKAENFPEMAPHSRDSGLTPFEPYLHTRWKEGCRNALQLWREVCVRGYGGTRRQVTKWVCRRREVPRRFSNVNQRQPDPTDTTLAPSQMNSNVTVTLPSAKRLAWLLVKVPEKLDARETVLLGVLQQQPVVASCHVLAQQFATMVRNRVPQKLPGWLKACGDSGIPEFASFVDGLKNDLSAIRAALTLEWSNGQLEGQVNRLKLIKRQMYGRAKFDLLRIRVLARI